MSLKIAFIGKMCSGKSTMCRYLQSIHSEFIVLSFAAKIKEIARDLFEMKKKDRALLQQIGTKMRELDSDVFAKYLIRQSNKSNFVLVDDVRYINELNYLKKNGFILVKLVISPQFQKKRIEQLYGEHSDEHLSRLGHSSETIQEQIDDKEFDVIIDVENDNVYKILERMLKIFRNDINTHYNK